MCVHGKGGGGGGVYLLSGNVRVGARRRSG